MDHHCKFCFYLVQFIENGVCATVELVEERTAAPAPGLVQDYVRIRYDYGIMLLRSIHMKKEKIHLSVTTEHT